MFSLFELAHDAGMCVSKRKTDKHKGKIKTNQQRKRNNKENIKYLHNVHGSVIRRSTFLGLGHSPERCLVVPLNSIIGRNWDPISQQLRMVPTTNSETLYALLFPHAVCPILGQGHLPQNFYQR